jgi:hypothetical protein
MSKNVSQNNGIVENKGVEPLTFPSTRDTLALLPISYFKKRLQIIELVENKGVEPLTFPSTRDTLALLPISYFKKTSPNH